MINKEQLRKFWDIVLKPKHNNYREIRIINVNSDKKTFFNNCREFAKQYPNIIVNKSVCFFVKSFDELWCIVSFNDYCFSFKDKICYGVNERVKLPDGSINGSYNCVKNVDIIFFDLERRDHEQISDFEKETSFKTFVHSVVSNLERYGLFEPVIVDSGSGVHLIFKIVPVSVTRSRREWFKGFVNDVSIKLVKRGSPYCIDGLKDFTRIAQLPFTLNPKREVFSKVLVFSSFVNNFRLGSKKKEDVINNEFVDWSLVPSVKHSLEFLILCFGESVPKNDRHNSLVFALKLLLRDKKVSHVPVQNVLREVFPDILLDPSNGLDGKQYSPFIVIGWCRRNLSWLKKHPLLFKVFESYVARFESVVKIGEVYE